MKKLFLLIFISLFAFTFAFAQKSGGTVRGKITDENGESVIGATIVLKSKPSVGTTTDLDGNYSLKVPDTTTEILVISFIGHNTIEETILPFFPVLIRNYILEPNKKEIKEVQVVGKAVKAKEYYMEKVKTNSATTIDYVSAETMKKTGDVSVTSAVARVPGVSTNSGGLITVRGIGDRYIKTAVNGSRIPTLDPFTNNIKLDLFPAHLVDNVIITKTASPDLPGDWAGAYISVETKDYPDQLSVDAETSVGYNNQSTFKEVTSSERSSTDWLGYDNGFRDHNHNEFVATVTTPTRYQELVALGLGSYYNSLGVTQQNWNQSSTSDETYFKLGLVQLGLLSKAQFNDPNAVTTAKSAYDTGIYHGEAYDAINAAAVKSSQSFPNNWNTTTTTVPLSFSQNFSIGNQIKLFGKPLGLNGGFRYASGIQYDPAAVSIRAKQGGRVENGVSLDNDTVLYKSGVEANSWSALLNAAYKFSPYHTIAVLFMPNVIGVNKARNGFHSNGLAEYTNAKTERLIDQYYESRKQTVYQLKSENYVPGIKLKADLYASYTLGSSTAPDFKTLSLPVDASSINSTDINTNVFNIEANRYYRYLTENVFDSRLAFELPIGDSTSAKTRKLKFGGAYQRDDRKSDQFAYRINYGPGASQIIGDADSDPFSPDKFAIQAYNSNGANAHTVLKYYVDDGQPTDHSIGYSSITAGYAMVDYILNPRWRFAGGLRVEQAHIFTDVKEFDSLGYAADDERRNIVAVGLANPGKLDEISYLPSANLIYKLRMDDAAPVNLRFNFSQTVARPSIRELSNTTMYDYELKDKVTGNPNLKMVQVNNYDLRYEHYFKNGDNVSASAFYKDFKNHIELVGFPDLGYFWKNNEDKSWLVGFEVEGKKSFAKHFEARANVTIVNSQSTFVKSVQLANGTFASGDTVKRTMYGQAPYVINAILSYNAEKLGLIASLSYNIQGSRFVIAGASVPDVYERPRNLLDAKITKSLGKHFSTSLKVRDILSTTIVRSYKFPEGYILDYDRYKYGTNFILSVSYKL